MNDAELAPLSGKHEQTHNPCSCVRSKKSAGLQGEKAGTVGGYQNALGGSQNALGLDDGYYNMVQFTLLTSSLLRSFRRT